MSSDADIQTGLSRLFHLGMELAERIQQDAMEATPAERAKLAVAFHRISRSVRQTAALKSRLDRDTARAQREATEAARDDHQRAVRRRQGRIKARVQELIWSEHEGEKAETLESTLEELLEADALEDDFLDLPIEAQVARLAEDFHLQAPPPQGELACEAPRSRTEGPSADAFRPSLPNGNPFGGAPPEAEQLTFDASG